MLCDAVSIWAKGGSGNGGGGGGGRTWLHPRQIGLRVCSLLVVSEALRVRNVPERQSVGGANVVVFHVEAVEGSRTVLELARNARTRTEKDATFEESLTQSDDVLPGGVVGEEVGTVGHVFHHHVHRVCTSEHSCIRLEQVPPVLYRHLETTRLTQALEG